MCVMQFKSTFALYFLKRILHIRTESIMLPKRLIAALFVFTGLKKMSDTFVEKLKVVVKQCYGNTAVMEFSRWVHPHYPQDNHAVILIRSSLSRNEDIEEAEQQMFEEIEKQGLVDYLDRYVITQDWIL